MRSLCGSILAGFALFASATAAFAAAPAPEQAPRFSSGLICYRLGGPPSRTVSLPFPCRLAALSYDGRKLLAADPAGALHRYDLQGKNDATYALPSAPVALALTAFADLALVALADGTLMALKSR